MQGIELVTKGFLRSISLRARRLKKGKVTDRRTIAYCPLLLFVAPL